MQNWTQNISEEYANGNSQFSIWTDIKQSILSHHLLGSYQPCSVFYAICALFLFLSMEPFNFFGTQKKDTVVNFNFFF